MIEKLFALVDEGVIRPIRWFHAGVDSEGEYCDPEDICRSCEMLGEGVICDQCDEDERLDTGGTP